MLSFRRKIYIGGPYYGGCVTAVVPLRSQFFFSSGLARPPRTTTSHACGHRAQKALPHCAWRHAEQRLQPGILDKHYDCCYNHTAKCMLLIVALFRYYCNNISCLIDAATQVAPKGRINTPNLTCWCTQSSKIHPIHPRLIIDTTRGNLEVSRWPWGQFPGYFDQQTEKTPGDSHTPSYCRVKNDDNK